MACDRDDVPIKTFTDAHGDLWLCRECAERDDEWNEPYDWDEGRHWRDFDIESVSNA